MMKNNTLILSGVEKKLKTMANWFSIISAISLFFMMFITAFDVFGRWLFTKPFYGSYELIGTLLIVAGPFSMAITQIDKRHISIKLVVDLLPSGMKKILSSIGLLLDLFIYGVITVGLFVLTWIYWQRGAGAVSEELGFRLIYPSICFFLAALLYTAILLIHFVQSIHEIVKKRR